MYARLFYLHNHLLLLLNNFHIKFEQERRWNKKIQRKGVQWSSKEKKNSISSANIDTGFTVNPPSVIPQEHLTIYQHAQHAYYKRTGGTLCKNAEEQLIPASWNKHRCVSSLLIPELHSDIFCDLAGGGWGWTYSLRWSLFRGAISRRGSRGHTAHIFEHDKVCCLLPANKMGDNSFSEGKSYTILSNKINYMEIYIYLYQLLWNEAWVWQKLIKIK